MCWSLSTQFTASTQWDSKSTLKASSYISHFILTLTLQLGSTVYDVKKRLFSEPKHESMLQLKKLKTSINLLRGIVIGN